MRGGLACGCRLGAPRRFSDVWLLVRTPWRGFGTFNGGCGFVVLFIEARILVTGQLSNNNLNEILNGKSTLSIGLKVVVILICHNHYPTPNLFSHFSHSPVDNMVNDLFRIVVLTPVYAI